MAKKPAVEVADALDSEVVQTISDEEYQRRTQLDVSDPLYINPSYDR